MNASDTLARWRVPLGWIFGLGALFLAAPTPLLYGVGLVVAGAGETIRLWAAGCLSKNKSLATGGPYGWTRNPLYFGSLWVGLGFALATGRIVLLFVVLSLFAAVYPPVMRREARHLEELFPEDYPDYAARVPLFWPRPPVAGAHGAFSAQRMLSNRELWTVCGWLAVAAMIGWKLL